MEAVSHHQGTSVLPKAAPWCLWVVLCPSHHSVAPWLHDQRLTRMRERGGLRLWVRQPWACSQKWAEMENGRSYI